MEAIKREFAMTKKTCNNPGMEIFFKNLKPISTNNLYTGMGKRRSKTKEYKYMEQVVKFSILKQGSSVRQFIGEPGLWKAPLKIELVFYVPKTKLFTKKCEISKTSGDLDNMQKSLIDAVFNSIGLDDSLVCDIVAKKRASNDSEHHISLKMSEMKMGELDCEYDDSDYEQEEKNHH